MGPSALHVAIVVSPGEDRPPGLNGLDELARVHLVATTEDLEVVAGDVEILYVWDFQTPLVQALWPKLTSLRWIQTSSAGVDAVLFEDLARSDVTLTNASGIYDEPIAEFVLTCLLVFAKDLLGTLALQRSRTWRHRDTERLAGRRLLVVGAGGIGRAIARLCRAAGMEVTIVARSARDDSEFGRILGSGNLDAALGDADDVVIAAPLTPETQGLFAADRFDRMKPGARLVNVGRGPIVDSDALVDALRAGQVGGAALDVFETEPLPASHPLWEMQNVIVSPHQSGDVLGWREEAGALFMENMRRFVAGEPLRNVVDKRQALAQAVR